MRKQSDGTTHPPAPYKLNNFKEFSEPKYDDDDELEGSPGTSQNALSDLPQEPLQPVELTNISSRSKLGTADSHSDVISSTEKCAIEDIPKASSLPSLSSGSDIFKDPGLGSEETPISGGSFRFNVSTQEVAAVKDISVKDTSVKDAEKDTFDMEQSLDLFSNIPPATTNPPQRPKRPKPPRPASKPNVAQESHPLMIDEPQVSEEPMLPAMKEMLQSPQPRKSFIPKPSNIPVKEVESIPYIESKSDFSRSADRLSIPDARKASKRQKYRAIKESLMSKASRAYNRYWYPKREEELKEADSKYTASDASDDSFYEIDTKEIEEIHEPEYSDDNVQTTQYNSSGFASPAVNTESEDNEEGAEVNVSSYRPIRTTDRSTHSQHSLNMFDVLIDKYQNQILSVLVVTASVVIYIIFFSRNRFLQGIILGITIPVVLLAAFWYLLKKEDRSADVATIDSVTSTQYSRLRSLGKKHSLKDFFQYTESQNFGELKVKSLPYRYIKLKGSILEAYELNATKDQVPNPTVLSQSEVKGYGLKLVFKLDITGWIVSIQPPAGISVSPQNMWKKRYPIWIRKEDWKPMSCEYLTEEGTKVASFFLFSPFSRYKELWYETLKAATGTTYLDVKQDWSEYRRDLLQNYSVFMERLFDRIPHKGYEEERSSSTNSTNSSEEETADKVKHSMKDVAWINALFGRFMWNILNDIKWDERIKDRIVRKLSSIQVSFISSVDLVNFSMGDSVPLITRTYLPKQDKQGTWSDMDMKWTGEVSMTLSVKFRTNQTHSSESSKTFEQMNPDPGSSAPMSGPTAGWVQTKLMRMIDKVEVSAKVTHLAGRVCVNIPPPPTDCLWYGFRSAPNFSIDIHPRIKGIDLSYQWLTKVLAKQLKILFEETFVLPSMENIVIPGMSRSITRDSDATNHNTDPDLLDVAPRR